MPRILQACCSVSFERGAAPLTVEITLLKSYLATRGLLVRNIMRGGTRASRFTWKFYMCQLRVHCVGFTHVDQIR